MVYQNSDKLSDIKFKDIIGAPLQAIIEGEAIAANATAEFIKANGFNNGQNGDNFGALRMVTFTCQKRDDKNELKNYKISVPLLALIPIPSIQIKSAEINFEINITDSYTTNQEDKTYGTYASSGQQAQQISGLGLKGEFARQSSGKQEETSTSNMKITLNIGQADIAAGLSRLFSIMDGSISEELANTPPKSIGGIGTDII